VNSWEPVTFTSEDVAKLISEAPSKIELSAGHGPDMAGQMK